MSIHYEYGGKYKWRLVNDVIKYNVNPIEGTHAGEYLDLMAGHLTIFKGYCWDGGSGPAIDTANFMRASLIHDALYQLMREGVIDRKKFRKRADQIMREIALEDGMSNIRARWIYCAVRIGARGSSKVDRRNQ